MKGSEIEETNGWPEFSETKQIMRAVSGACNEVKCHLPRSRDKMSGSGSGNEELCLHEACIINS